MLKPFKFNDKINPKQGTIDITTHYNFFAVDSRIIIIDKFKIQDTVFALYRTTDMMLIFSHTSPNHGQRLSKLNLHDVGNAQKYKVTITWSDDTVILYMGALGVKSGKLIIGDFEKINSITTEQMTSTFSYEISDYLQTYNFTNISTDEIKEVFSQHDDVIKLDESNDDSPLICAKYFDEYYIFAQAQPIIATKTILILSARKIPNKFIDTLSEQNFVTIISSFHEKVAENFIWKAKILDDVDHKKELATLAFSSVIYEQKYRNFLREYS